MPKHAPEYWGTYARLEAAMGAEATARLVEVFGGQRLWIPVPIGKNHWRPQGRQVLIGALGEQAAQALFKAFGGSSFTVPMSEKLENQKLKHQAAEMHRSHASINEVAAAVGRSRRTVFRWLNEPISNLR